MGLSKTKEQLSGTEERYKSLQLDMQRTQMDLLAKTSTLPLEMRWVCTGGVVMFTVHKSNPQPIMTPLDVQRDIQAESLLEVQPPVARSSA